jgi:bifunctional UDP-N-acetylglucosamine pyrophosphorylase/glucosamine-1-phosphate N-acetyltransferase
MVAERAVGKVDDVVVLPGDEPLVTGEMLQALLRRHRRRSAVATVQTTILDDPSGFGRVVREGDVFLRIVEQREATAAERRIREASTCVYGFDRSALFGALPLVTTDNVQHEYYLPDVPKILLEKGERVLAELADYGGTLGINSRAELARATDVMRARINAAHMAAGVTLIDPSRTYIDVEVRIGHDTVVMPMTFLQGSTRISEGCTIGPSTLIEDSRVGEGSVVELSVVRRARVGRQASVGPYAHLRSGAVIEDRAKAGSFVEIKNATIGRDSKVPHLSYVGDARVGRDVNVGAGTVTVNYDGYRKHRTVIEDEARVGSDTMLVAPIKVGRGAVTGAGSVITENVPPGALAIERSEQRNISGYRKKKDARAKGKGSGG